jgi:signal transduction histidine kinase/DNA-binding response OmpR family regulator
MRVGRARRAGPGGRDAYPGVPPWLACGLIQVVAAGGFFLVPAGVGRGVVLLLASGLAVGALAVAAGRSRGGTRFGWATLAVAQTLSAAAWVCWYLYPVLASLPTPPVVGDALFMTSYLLTAVGLGRLARQHGADREAVLDAAVLATALGVVLWALLLSRGYGESVSPLAALIAKGYLVLDVGLVAVMAALAFAVRRSLSAPWLFAAVALQLAADTIFCTQVLAGTFQFGGAAFAGWLLNLGALTVAALLPERDMRSRGTASLRLGIVGVAVLSLPVLLVIRSVQSSARDTLVIAGGSVLVTMLVLARVLLSGGSAGLPGPARAALRRSVVRVCAAFVVLALLPLAGLTYMSVREADRTVHDEAQRRLDSSASVTASYIGDFMETLGGLVDSYASRRLLGAELAALDADPAELQRHVSTLRSHSEEFAGAWILDAAGDLVAVEPARPDELGRNFANRDFFRGPISTGKPHVSAVFEGVLAGNPPVVAVSAPVVANGRWVGVTAVGYRLTALSAYTASLSRMQDLNLIVTDRHGTLLTGPGTDDAGTVSGMSDTHVAAALAGRSGSARGSADGVDTLSAYRPVPGLGWAVVAQIPVAHAYSGAVRFTARVLALTILLVQILLAGLVLAVRVERRRRIAETELAVARDEALEASRLKLDFVANMSHEIRTPMNGVIGLTTLLADTELDDRQRDMVATIQNSADALLNVINDILDFSKIEAGKLAIDPVDFDPRAVAEDVAALLAAPAHEKRLELTTKVAPAIPPMLVGDAHRIRQVLTNLVSNAIKFTPKGEVIIGVAIGTPNPDSGLHVVRFTVSDTGIGIPLDRQDHLFEAFTQADSSTTRFFGGTGLGLTISRQLVELMGGTIGLASRPGDGSSFHFTLTLPPSTSPRPHPQPAPDLAGTRVLIVDDNGTNRQVLLDLLATFRMRPTAVPDAVTALHELRGAIENADPYRIALLDYHMPGIDGLALAAAIAADPATAATRMAMLTSTDQSTELTAARDAGVTAYLTKPVRAAHLHAMLEQLLCAVSSPDAPRMIRQYNHPFHASVVQAPQTVSGATETAVGPGARPAPADRGRILVAEDNEVNRQVIAGMLATLGYDYDLAVDGEQALQFLHAHHYDAVLMDVQMPRLDGLEATRRLRRLATPLRDIPVIALTASALPSDEQRCRAAGMNEFLSKPIRTHVLAATLDAVLDATHPAPL